MYTILKPEARKYIQEVEGTLEENGFNIRSRHPIKSWNNLAQRVYSPQLTDPTFAGEFASYLWLTNNFFGDSAAVLRLSKAGDLERNLLLLDGMKAKIRKRIDINDAKVRIVLNLDRLDPERKHDIGTFGTLGIQGDNFEPIGEEGRWDNYYFKYVHVPDPNIESYQREIGVLERSGVFHQEISQDQWNLMKQMQSLSVPNLRREEHE